MCLQVLIARGADIVNQGMNSLGQTITLSQIDLGTSGDNPDNYDLSHAHSAFTAMCNANPSTGICAMNGADLVTVTCGKNAEPLQNSAWLSRCGLSKAAELAADQIAGTRFGMDIRSLQKPRR